MKPIQQLTVCGMRSRRLKMIKNGASEAMIKDIDEIIAARVAKNSASRRKYKVRAKPTVRQVTVTMPRSSKPATAEDVAASRLASKMVEEGRRRVSERAAKFARIIGAKSKQ